MSNKYVEIQDKWRNFIEQEGVKFGNCEEHSHVPSDWDVECWIDDYINEHKDAETEDFGLGGEEEWEAEMMEWIVEAELYTVEERQDYISKWH